MWQVYMFCLTFLALHFELLTVQGVKKGQPGPRQGLQVGPDDFDEDISYDDDELRLLGIEVGDPRRPIDIVVLESRSTRHPPWPRRQLHC